MVYQLEIRDADIWHAELSGTGPSERRLISSTWSDLGPRFSPDGSSVAFHSNRYGDREIWIAASDGSRARQLTYMRGPWTDAPRWSPDGRRIAFTAHHEGNRDIYVIDVSGGTPRRLTHEPSEEGRPSWSADGRFIYFRSDRSGTAEIWKVSSDAGSPRRITTGGGYEGFESPDGATLFYTRDRARPGLWSVPAEGGEAVRVADNVHESYWGVANDGVYYLDALASRAADRTYAIRRVDFSTRRNDVVARVGSSAGDLWAGFSVRADGRAVLWCQTGRHTSDLLLVDDFR
jgi:tricorn protease-like protein